MTREEKLWTMTGTTLLGVAEKLGIKTSKSTLKQGKEKLIAKILEAEHIVEETDKIEDAKEQEKKDVETAEKETKDLYEKETDKAEASAKPERKRGQLIEYNGKAQNICAWAKELGKSANTLYGRIYKLGWSVEDAFEK